jgi:single-strand DNA-binding protein
MATRKKTTDTTAQTTTEDQRPTSNSGVNRAHLIGRLVADAQLRKTSNGTSVTTIRIATSGPGETQFVDVVLWRQLAEFATTYLGKGRLVYVDGRLRTRTWEAVDGSTRRTIEIVADRLQALPGNRRQADAA